MPRPRLAPQELQAIHDFAAPWGKIVARRAFGAAGPGRAVDFQALEEVARAAAAGVAAGTLDVLLGQQQDGLPVTSSLVESLVGELNAWVKGREKLCNRPEGAAAIRQVRAALLSQDGGLARHFGHRPGNPYRRRKAK